MQANLRKLADKWPSTIVSRGKVGEFTGGLIHPRTLANLDSLGKGPAGRVRVGRKVAYDVDSLLVWLETRLEIISVG